MISNTQRDKESVDCLISTLQDILMSHALCLRACYLFICVVVTAHNTTAWNNLAVLRCTGASMAMFSGIWLLAGAQLLTMLYKTIQHCSTLSIYPPGHMWHSGATVCLPRSTLWAVKPTHALFLHCKCQRIMIMLFFTHIGLLCIFLNLSIKACIDRMSHLIYIRSADVSRLSLQQSCD